MLYHLFPYCIINKHDDVLAVFRLSETACTACKAMNDINGTVIFTVEMTSNCLKSEHING